MAYGTYTLIIALRISLSFPTREIAPTAMAMLCGEIILPTHVPEEFAAASQAALAPIALAAWVCKLQNNTLLDVTEQVIKVPKEKIIGAMKG